MTQRHIEAAVVLLVAAATVTVKVLFNVWTAGELFGMAAPRMTDGVLVSIHRFVSLISVVIVLAIVRPRLVRGVIIAGLYLLVITGLGMFIGLLVMANLGLYL